MSVRSPIYSAKSAQQPIGYIESDKVFDVFDRLCANYDSASGLVRSHNDDALLGYISLSNVFVGPRRIRDELFAKATAEVVARMQRDEKVSDDEIFVAGTREHANIAPASPVGAASGATPCGRSANSPPPPDLVVHLGEWSEFEQAASIEQPVDRRDSAASTSGAMWAIPYRQEGGDDGASEEDRTVVEKFAANDETGRNAVADSAEKFHPEGSNERHTTTHESGLEESLPEANWRVDCLSAAVETTAKPALNVRGADHGTRVVSDDGDRMVHKHEGDGRELAVVEAFMQCIAEYADAGEDRTVAELDAHGHDSAVGPSATVPRERFTGDQKGLTCDGAAAAELPDGQSEPSAEHAPHAESYAANGPAAILMVKNEPADVIEVAAVAKAEHVETIRPQPLPDGVEGPSGNVPMPGDHNALENSLPDWPRDDIGHSESESLVPAENAFGGSVEGMPNPAFNDQEQPGRIGIIEHDDPVEQDIAPVGNDDAPSCAFEQAANLDVQQTELSSFDGQKSLRWTGCASSSRRDHRSRRNRGARSSSRRNGQPFGG